MGSVPAPANRLQVPGGRASGDSRQERPALGPVVWVKQVDVPADHVFRGVAVQLLGTPVPREDRALESLDEHRVSTRVHDRLKGVCGFLTTIARPTIHMTVGGLAPLQPCRHRLFLRFVGPGGQHRAPPPSGADFRRHADRLVRIFDQTAGLPRCRRRAPDSLGLASAGCVEPDGVLRHHRLPLSD